MSAYSTWTAEDVRRLRSGFDTLTLPGAEFSHAAHIAVGATYVRELGPDKALLHLREAIPRYNVSQGGENTDTRGYHETLTRFWVERITDFLKTLPPQTSLEESALAAVVEFSTRVKLFEEYYSFDVVRSLDARRGWVAPDRQPG